MNEQRHISEEDLSAYLDGQLTPDEAAAVEQAVAADPDMAYELESLRQMRELIGGLEPELAPANMAEEVLRRVHSRRMPRNRLVIVRWVTIAATLLVVFGGAMVMLQALREENVSRDSQQDRILAGKSPVQKFEADGDSELKMLDKSEDRMLGVQVAALEPSAEGTNESGAWRYKKTVAAGPVTQEETIVIYVDNLTEGQKAVEQVLASNAMELVPVGQKPLALNQAQNFIVPSPQNRATGGRLIPSQNETVYLANATPRQNERIVSELRMQVVARQAASQLPEPIYNNSISPDASRGARELMTFQRGKGGGEGYIKDAARQLKEKEEKKPIPSQERLAKGISAFKQGDVRRSPSGMTRVGGESEVAPVEAVTPAKPAPSSFPSAPVATATGATPCEPATPADVLQVKPVVTEAGKPEKKTSPGDWVAGADAGTDKYKELWQRREANLAKERARVDGNKTSQDVGDEKATTTRPQVLAESRPLSRPASLPRQQQLRIVLRVREPVKLNASQRENLKQAEMDLYQQNRLHSSQLRVLEAKDAKQK